MLELICTVTVRSYAGLPAERLLQARHQYADVLVSQFGTATAAAAAHQAALRAGSHSGPGQAKDHRDAARVWSQAIGLARSIALRDAESGLPWDELEFVVVFSEAEAP
jgi:hypothetical protein